MPKLLSPESNGVCLVNAMPIISEGDPRVADSIFWTNVPPIPVPPPAGVDSIPTWKTFIQGFSCYDASICSIAIAVLASRNYPGAPGGRTKVFESIPATDALPAPATLPAIPKELNQLAWQMNTAGTSQAFYYPEILADFGPVFQPNPPEDPFVYAGGSNLVFTSNFGAAFCDVTTLTTAHITDEYVIALLQNDFGVQIGFLWTVPTPSPTDTNVVTLVPGETHRLVVSGIRNGEYPLQVNDIFNGLQQWTRLVPIAQSSRSFGTGGVGSEAITNLAQLPSGFISNLRTAWRQQRPRSVGKDQIDAFSLSIGSASQTVFEATWGEWTHLGFPSAEQHIAGI